MGKISAPVILNQRDMERIHEATLMLLEKKGVNFESEEAREIFASHGARVDGEQVFMPPALVEKCLRSAPGKFVLDAVNPARSVTVGEGLLIHPCGGESFVSRGKRNREKSSLKDFEDIQKLYQACENMDMTGYQPLVPYDVPINKRSLECAFATMLYTDKPWLAPMSFEGAKSKQELLKLYDMAFGESFVDTHYVTWNVVSPNSPFRYVEVACEGIMEFARKNQPVCIVSAPMTGITAPIHLLSAILLQNLETIAGLCLAQLVRPGVPVLPSASLAYGNLRFASFECASPDTAVMMVGAIQMYKQFYHLPARAQTGVTSSKCLDYQAGYETMQSLLLCALFDVNVTSQSAGSLENLMTLSFEKTLIDDEIISRVRKIVDGLDTSEEQLGLDILMDSRPEQDFLMHESTLDAMYDSWQPAVSDWSTYEFWSGSNYPDISKRAEKKAEELIGNAKQLLNDSLANDMRRYIDTI